MPTNEININSESVVSNEQILSDMLQERDASKPETTENLESAEPTEVEEEPLEVVNEEVSNEAETEEEAKPEVEELPKDNSKQTEAFIKMRKDNENLRQQMAQMQSQTSILEDLAKDNNMEVSEFIEAFKQQREQEQIQEIANKQGIPVEIAKKLNDMEKQLNELKTKPEIEKFNTQNEELRQKYNLDDTKITEFWKKAQEEGFDLLKVKSIENVFKYMNPDMVINKKEQDLLQKKEQIKKSSLLVPTDTKSVVTEADLDKKVTDFLAGYNIKI